MISTFFNANMQITVHNLKHIHAMKVIQVRNYTKIYMQSFIKKELKIH